MKTRSRTTRLLKHLVPFVIQKPTQLLDLSAVLLALTVCDFGYGVVRRGLGHFRELRSC